MSKIDETRAPELAEKLEKNSSRLTESHDGEGTTHQPVLEYLDKNEKDIPFGLDLWLSLHNCLTDYSR